MILDKIIEKPKVLQDNPNGKDSNIKSLAKAVSWRIVGTIDTMFISFMITGKLTLAISIGGIEVFSKIFLYYLHERIWEKFLPAKNSAKTNA